MQQEPHLEPLDRRQFVHIALSALLQPPLPASAVDGITSLFDDDIPLAAIREQATAMQSAAL